MPKLVKIGLTILVIVILLSVGGVILLLIYVRSTWTLPTRGPLPNNVEVIISDEGLNSWSLSPGGDKIIYETTDDFLLFPATQHKQRLSNCRHQIWLDNDTLYCRDSSLIEIDNEIGEMTAVPVHKVKASDVDLGTLLQQAGSIYKFSSNSDLSQSLLLRDVANPLDLDKHYLVDNIENVDTVSQAYAPITLPLPLPNYNKKIFSPNGMYYYEYNDRAHRGIFLTIYNTSTNDKVSEFVEEGNVSLRVSGWAADNSGVYFEMVSSGIDPTNLNQILKLKL